jgi:hypothetical protein
MKTSAEEFEQKVNEILRTLNAQLGTDDYFYGIVKTTPFLFKVISGDPAVLLFKLRIVESGDRSHGRQVSSDQYLGTLGIECEFDEKYMWLWMRKTDLLSSKQIVEVVEQSVDNYSEYFPSPAGYCFVCKEKRMGTLVQDDVKIATVCSECMGKALERKDVLEKKLNNSSLPLATLLPLGLLMSSSGWAGFWFLYHKIFEILGVKFIVLPQIVILIIVAGAAFCLAFPVAKLLFHSGVTKILSRALVSIILTILTVCLGELIFVVVMLIPFEEGLTMLSVFSIMLRMEIGADIIYTIYKLAFAGALGFVIYELTAPKEVKIEI